MSETIALCYHGVSAGWANPLVVAPQRLEEQIAWFLRRGYEPVTVQQAAHGGGGKRLVITFDDALRSVYTRALPQVERLGAVATVYAVARNVADGTPMAWPEVRDHLATEHAGELDGMSVAPLRD
ncbi:MAG: polysaccharide deacetylase family protein, partial [Conexibacter sp.]